METVIVDAGPLVAYLKKDVQYHGWVAERFQHLRAPMLSCDAVLSEAFFRLSRPHGGTRQLLALLERGLGVPAFDLRGELATVSQLLLRYENVSMSLADACLVRMAELRTGASVFTLDSDFEIYRKNRRQIIPLITALNRRLVRRTDSDRSWHILLLVLVYTVFLLERWQ